MSDFDHIRKQGDTGDPLTIWLKDAGSVSDENPQGYYAIPNGSTVKLYVESQGIGGDVLIDGGTMTADPDQDTVSSTKETTTRGKCTYAWTDGDVENAGEFYGEVRLLLPTTNKPITFPRDPENPYMTIQIEKKLG